MRLPRPVGPSGPRAGTGRLSRWSVGAAARASAGSDESYYGDRRYHGENSECDPGFSADRHRISFRRKSFIGTTTVELSEIGRIADAGAGGPGPTSSSWSRSPR